MYVYVRLANLTIKPRFNMNEFPKYQTEIKIIPHVNSMHEPEAEKNFVSTTEGPGGEFWATDVIMHAQLCNWFIISRNALDQSERTWRFVNQSGAKLKPIVSWLTQVFPRFTPVAHFPALGAGCTFLPSSSDWLGARDSCDWPTVIGLMSLVKKIKIDTANWSLWLRKENGNKKKQI